jgi:hypothetical protein
MGTWGHGIRLDDFVCDVIGAFEELLKAGESLRDASKTMKSRFAAEIQDADEGPLFWIALADMQWTYGELEPQVLIQVQEDFSSGRSLDRWTEDERGLSLRRTALEKFLNKITVPNPRPKKPPKIVSRAPKFRAGDCLSVRLADGRYAAAIVLAADHSRIEYGKNLIGVLDYLSAEKPPVEIFHSRRWLIRNHHSFNNVMDLAWYLPVGFRASKDRIEVVDNIEVLNSDSKDSSRYSGWACLGEQVVYQREWDMR